MGGMFSGPSMPTPPPPPPPPPVVAPAPVVEKMEPTEADKKVSEAQNDDAMKRRRARSTSRTLATLTEEETKNSVLGG